MHIGNGSEGLVLAESLWLELGLTHDFLSGATTASW